MRDIKFRAWDCKTKLFGTVVELSYSPISKLIYVPSYVRVHDYKDMTHVTHYSDPDYIQDKLVIEQYTGLHDKNGKEIYESDIVALTDNSYMDEDIQHERVYYNEKSEWVAGKIYLSKVYFNVEVIGNIHENKELLEGEQ
ncbi:hypothetical protein R55227_BLOPHJLP_00248 [Fructobacillus tropaeoli]|uniref:YopX family protein n=1 Tax=Fructobacillus tropaeoli TaxID=709323 RepID=UPI002D837488|nr:hypothetical protein R55227_BLOPHJLP_00248 [Fructobacillus tropaeoli]